MSQPAAERGLSCRHYGRCGGCSMLELPIAEQLARKQAAVQQILAPLLDNLQVASAPPQRSPRYDRISLLFPAQPLRGQLQLGIYARGSHRIVPIEDCRIQQKALTRLAVATGELLRELGMPAYDESTQRGLVRALKARILPNSRELLLGLIVTDTNFRGRDALAQRLWQTASMLRSDDGQPLQVAGLVLNHNPAVGNFLLGPTNLVLRGKPWQYDQVDRLRLRVSFSSFYQHHRHADALLFQPALAMLGDVQGRRVVDGYGGVGAFGLRLLARGAAQVTIIESNPSSCADAADNLQRAGYAGGELREQPFGSEPLPACDLLVADPPRAGLQQQGVAAILAARPERVLLVSCAVAAAARDLAALQSLYRIVELRLCDLFPHTEHVELLTLLQRR